MNKVAHKLKMCVCSLFTVYCENQVISLYLIVLSIFYLFAFKNHVCVCLCMYVCMYVCMYNVYVCVCMCVYMCVCVCMYVCMLDFNLTLFLHFSNNQNITII